MWGRRTCSTIQLYFNTAALSDVWPCSTCVLVLTCSCGSFPSAPRSSTLLRPNCSDVSRPAPLSTLLKQPAGSSESYIASWRSWDINPEAARQLRPAGVTSPGMTCSALRKASSNGIVSTSSAAKCSVSDVCVHAQCSSGSSRQLCQLAQLTHQA